MEGADLHKYYKIECRNHQHLRRPGYVYGNEDPWDRNTHKYTLSTTLWGRNIPSNVKTA